MTPKTKGRSADDFLRENDPSVYVPAKFKAGIAALGPKGWLYEGEFQKVNKISTTHGAAYRDQFKDFIVETQAGKRAFCGSVALAKELRARLAKAMAAHE